MIYIDRALSQLLEAAEARANASFVEARSRIVRGSGAEWIDVGGTYAMFDGPDSPCTQTFGFGLFSEPTGEQLDALEHFFAERGAAVHHEVSPLADLAVLLLLNQIDYFPVELSTVLCRPLAMVDDGPERKIRTRNISSSEVELWAATSAAGWGTESEGLKEFMLDFGRIAAHSTGSYPFIAELDGDPIATGSLFIDGQVAVLAGASTIPRARNLGAQNALLYDRLRFAAQHGCTIASMAALPGSQSQINAQKNGFQIAYTRTKWVLNRESDDRE